MKNLLINILFFFATSCFAIDQNLIDADEQYFAAELKLSRIEKEIIDTKQKLEDKLWRLEWEENKTGNSRLDTQIELYRAEVEEKQKLLDTLIAQQIETKKLLQKLEPLKREYEKQRKLENQYKELIETTIVILIISTLIAVFVAIIYFAVAQHKKYQRLLKEGKITRQEYDRIMQQCHQSKSMFSNDLGMNPSTGLPLVGNGVCDAGGNLRGSSETRSSFDYSRNYNSSNMR